MSLALVIVLLIFGVLALASKLHETRYQLTVTRTELEAYAHTYELLTFASQLPSDQFQSLMAQARDDRQPQL